MDIYTQNNKSNVVATANKKANQEKKEKGDTNTKYMK